MKSRRPRRRVLPPGILAVSRSGRILLLGRNAARLLDRYFPRAQRRDRLPRELRSWLRERPLSARSWKCDGRRIFVFPMDTGRKGAVGLQITECPVTEECLTPAQQEVAFLIHQGRSDPTIAIIRETSPATVKKQVQQALDATGLDNRVMLALNC